MSFLHKRNYKTVPKKCLNSIIVVIYIQLIRRAVHSESVAASFFLINEILISDDWKVPLKPI